MSFIFRILPENLADAAIEIAFILALVAFLAMLIERLRKPRKSTP